MYLRLLAEVLQPFVRKGVHALLREQLLNLQRDLRQWWSRVIALFTGFRQQRIVVIRLDASPLDVHGGPQAHIDKAQDGQLRLDAVAQFVIAESVPPEHGPKAGVGIGVFPARDALRFVTSLLRLEPRQRRGDENGYD